MSNSGIIESDVVEAALDWLKVVSWSVVYGPDIAPDTPSAERAEYDEVILKRRLRDALARLNPGLPAEAQDDAFRRLTRSEGPTLQARNRAFHRMVVDGVTVKYRGDNSSIRGAQARVLDFEEPANND